nr:arginase family protein [uncultured Bacillus sp.]
MLQRYGVTVLDFDHTYIPQKAFHNHGFEWIDLSDIDSANRYCDKNSFEKIYSRLQKRRNRGFTFIGSGNYHYVSLLLLSEIKEPFTLVLFDHHTDMLHSPSESIITCGSWVLAALEHLPLLKKVIMIGVEEESSAAIRKFFKKKLAIFPMQMVGGDENLPGKIIAEIDTNAVYISVDKDVLSESEVMTDWDQGKLTLEKLDALLFYITSAKKIIGEDVCGEYPRSAIEYYNEEIKQIIQKNERANLNILKIALKAERSAESNEYRP